MYIIMNKGRILGTRLTIKEAFEMIDELVNYEDLRIELDDDVIWDSKNSIIEDCIINTYFTSVNSREQYCKLNCKYRCHKNQDYKKINKKQGDLK